MGVTIGGAEITWGRKEKESETVHYGGGIGGGRHGSVRCGPLNFALIFHTY